MNAAHGRQICRSEGRGRRTPRAQLLELSSAHGAAACASAVSRESGGRGSGRSPRRVRLGGTDTPDCTYSNKFMVPRPDGDAPAAGLGPRRDDDGHVYVYLSHSTSPPAERGAGSGLRRRPRAGLMA